MNDDHCEKGLGLSASLSALNCLDSNNDKIVSLAELEKAFAESGYDPNLVNKLDWPRHLNDAICNSIMAATEFVDDTEKQLLGQFKVQALPGRVSEVCGDDLPPMS